MIISKGAKMGQKIVAIIFSVFYVLLLYGYIRSGNYNYLAIIGFSFIAFLPVFVYTLRFYDIVIEGDVFVISNLFVKREINISLFIRVLPAKDVLPLLSSPYFSLHFNNDKKFYFQRKRPPSEMFKSRSSISQKITNEILEYLDKLKNERNYN